MVFVGGGGERALRAAYVADAEDGQCELEILCGGAPERGEVVSVHYLEGRRFMRRDARVAWSHRDRFVRLEFSSEGEHAEARDCFRVGAPAGAYTVLLPGDVRGALLDVSAEGMAVRARGAFRVGQRLPVVLVGAPRPVGGAAEIRVVRANDDGSYRLGLRACDERDALCKGLSALSVSLQREQLATQAEDESYW